MWNAPRQSPISSPSQYISHRPAIHLTLLANRGGLLTPPQFNRTTLPDALNGMVSQPEFTHTIDQCNSVLRTDLSWIGRGITFCGIALFMMNFILPWVIDIFSYFFILPICGFGGIILMTIGRLLSNSLRIRATGDEAMPHRILSERNEYFNAPNRECAIRRPIRWSCSNSNGVPQLDIDMPIDPPIAPVAATPMIFMQAGQSIQTYAPPLPGSYISNGGIVTYHQSAQPAVPSYPQPAFHQFSPATQLAPPPSYTPSSSATAASPPPSAPGGMLVMSEGSTSEGVVNPASAPNVSSFGFCAQCGVPRKRIEDRFCAACGTSYGQ